VINELQLQGRVKNKTAKEQEIAVKKEAQQNGGRQRGTPNTPITMPQLQQT